MTPEAKAGNILLKEALDLAVKNTPSPLVKKYLGRKPFKEIEIGGASCQNAILRQFAILFTLTGLRDSVRLICQAQAWDHLNREEGAKETLRWSLATLHWCATELNLTGYATLFNRPITLNYMHHRMASRSIGRLITKEDPLKRYGNETTHGLAWEPGSIIPTLRIFLDEISYLCIHRRYPFTNDLGWDDQQFAQEITANTRLIRVKLGLPPELPTWPEDPRTVLPPNFTSFTTD